MSGDRAGAAAGRLSAALLADMERKGVDAALTLEILDDWNAGLYEGVAPVRATGVPAVDGRRVVPLGAETRYALPAELARARLRALDLPLPPGARRAEGSVEFDHAALAALGESLYPRAAYGLLNGGSATSYADVKKNQAFGTEVFELLRPGFDALSPACRDRPKGLSPAWLNPDGSPGESFLVLKLRARLLAALRHRGEGKAAVPVLRLFQMSSSGNDAELAAAYADYESHPFLAPLAERLGEPAASFMTGIQPLVAAFSHSAEGRTKRVFDRAWGAPDSVLPLPGGHGQCFRVLAPTLRALRDKGVRWAWLGNVDNLGFLPDPAALALLALSGEPAAFELAYRTPVDVKGGILVETAGGGMTIADIGPAISFDELLRLEAAGRPALFNCATGLFDLDWLVPRIDDLGRRLPVRFTDQDKDAGRYSQAEQVTWEVTSLLPSFLALAVDKYGRFIAAKLLAETLLTSGVGAGDPRLPPALAETQSLLRAGLARILSGPCGLRLEGGRWLPA